MLICANATARRQHGDSASRDFFSGAVCVFEARRRFFIFFKYSFLVSTLDHPSGHSLNPLAPGPGNRRRGPTGRPVSSTTTVALSLFGREFAVALPADSHSRELCRNLGDKPRAPNRFAHANPVQTLSGYSTSDSWRPGIRRTKPPSCVLHSTTQPGRPLAWRRRIASSA